MNRLTATVLVVALAATANAALVASRDLSAALTGPRVEKWTPTGDQPEW